MKKTSPIKTASMLRLSAKRKADKVFSEYIRKREIDQNGYTECITCGRKFHWKDIDCGHFISRRYEATRYDELNSNPQCRSCNRFNQGRQLEYAVALNKKYGIGTAEGLLEKSKMICRRTRFDYEAIILMYKS